MVWVEFIVSAAVIVLAATQLVKYGDIIAFRTRLGGMFVGLVLLAGATSLPELLTTISSITQGVPNLAAGNLFGSNMFNMLILATLGFVSRKKRLLREAAIKHALSGSLAIFLIALVIFFMLAGFSMRIGPIGVDSIVIILTYLAAIWLLQTNTSKQVASEDEPVPADYPSLRRGLIGFTIASVVLIWITPILVKSSTQISDITGLGTTFIGTTLVAIVTSLPELVTTLAALKIGASDMAIGNLFGSNIFNMFAVGVADLFYSKGSFLSVIDPTFLLVGMLGLLMTGMGLIGNLARLKRKIWFLEIDSLALILAYVIGMILLYFRGISQ